jgi:hypothetical protein
VYAATRIITVAIDLPKLSLPSRCWTQLFRDSDPVRSSDDRIRPRPILCFEFSCCVFAIV